MVDLWHLDNLTSILYNFYKITGKHPPGDFTHSVDDQNIFAMVSTLSKLDCVTCSEQALLWIIISWTLKKKNSFKILRMQHIFLQSRAVLNLWKVYMWKTVCRGRIFYIQLIQHVEHIQFLGTKCKRTARKTEETFRQSQEVTTRLCL